MNDITCKIVKTCYLVDVCLRTVALYDKPIALSSIIGVLHRTTASSPYAILVTTLSIVYEELSIRHCLRCNETCHACTRSWEELLWNPVTTIPLLEVVLDACDCIELHEGIVPFTILARIHIKFYLPLRRTCVTRLNTLYDKRVARKTLIQIRETLNGVPTIGVPQNLIVLSRRNVECYTLLSSKLIRPKRLRLTRILL